jgi:2-hydroxychromene-2-carboxylate isomerase
VSREPQGAVAVAVTAWVTSARWADDGGVDLRLLYFDVCPNWTVAEQRLRSALAQVGLPGQQIQHVLVATSEDAVRYGLVGSPTILIDGHDPFASGHEQPALACRVFSTPEGLAGSPTVDQLVEALS